jgi:hypothetical protein
LFVCPALFVSWTCVLQKGLGEKACAAYLNSCELFSVPEPLVAVALSELRKRGSSDGIAVPMLLQARVLVLRCCVAHCA